MLPKTIEIRALNHMEKGVEAVEAVKLAIEEENNFVWLLLGIDMKSGTRCREDIKDAVFSELCEKVYYRIKTIS